MAKKVFICGPMTGIKDNNTPNFNAVATTYRNKGHEVINPADNGPYDEHSDYLKVSLRQVMECEMIVLLPGWEDSKGAKVEWAVAEVCGLEVVTQFLLPYEKETVLEEAARITSGARNEEYGEPKDNHRCTVTIITA